MRKYSFTDIWNVILIIAHFYKSGNIISFINNRRRNAIDAIYNISE